MSFKTDNNGNAVSIPDAKISAGSNATWSTRLKNIKQVKGKICIATFSLPDLPYARKILERRPRDISIVAHAKFTRKAQAIKARFPSIRIAVREDIHAKFVLIEPGTVWLSSANFGYSGWIENSIGLHSKKAYKYYKSAFDEIFSSSAEIEVPEESGNDPVQYEQPETLKPCPICGAEITERNIIMHRNSICIKCECGALGGLSGSLTQSIIMWNTGKDIHLPKRKEQTHRRTNE